MSRDMKWREPEAGFEYEPDEVLVTPEYQHEKLRACGISPEIFGGCVDPSFYIGLGIHAGIRSGISAEGNVNMLQSLVQYRPVALGESLRVCGVITAVTPVPRGWTIDTDVWFEDAQGGRVIGARRRSLKPDPSKTGTSGAGDRPQPVIEAETKLQTLARHRLTPEQVVAYSSEGNSIHYDMAASNRAGFRAPLIGGGMGVHYLMAALWSQDVPGLLDLDIFFRRPIFWDETFEVAISAEQDAICLRQADSGKVFTEARINARSSAEAA